MTNQQLKELEDNLWDAANSLRAYGGIKAADYAVPVLGLIFLKFADNKYSQYEDQILKEYTDSKGTRMERTIQKIAIATCGFYLPDDARFNHLLNLSRDESLAKALKTAMEGIEKYQDAKFQDVLPTEAYFEIEKKKDDILPELLKTFSDIPKDATGDVFGKIYQYFLGKFAKSEGQKGGEFFTPTSVVRFIVEVIEPYSGKIYDPACGSGGMFVQSATFIREANRDLDKIYVYGQEYMGETVRLAKMNLLVNHLRGDIMETNSYEQDPYNSYGAFDFVMANPPFNVKSVKESTVKNDKRFYEYGLPKNKGKKDDKISDANYLWISLFATALNKTGRAGFVMPNSASDARNAEYDIRKNMVDTGIVDCMVSMPSNMFLTVTLPATLWFFDKQKIHTPRKDKILFIDARNVYKQIDRAHREWTEEHQQNLAAIVRLYRGETHRYLELVARYIQEGVKAYQAMAPHKERIEAQLTKVHTDLSAFAKATKGAKRTPTKTKVLKEARFFEQVADYKRTTPEVPTQELPEITHTLETTPVANDAQKNTVAHLEAYTKQHTLTAEAIKKDTQALVTLWKLADKNAKVKNDADWTTNNLPKADKALEEALQLYLDAGEEFTYWLTHATWLQTRFPEATYQDVTGLCKLANKTEYVDEQDYSLNAGRYVGVELESDKITIEEFNERILKNSKIFTQLNVESRKLEKQIESNLKMLIS